MRLLVTLLLAALPCLAVSATISAQEARCTALGAACACSEPLTAATYTNNGASWRPASGLSAKPCSMEATGYPIARNSPVTGTNASAVLSKLPAGHSVPYVLWAGDDNTGIFWIGNAVAASADCGSGYQRCETRFYLFKSVDFMPTGKVSGVNQCSGDKHAEIKFSSGPDSVINPAQEVSGDGMAIYNFANNGWTPNVDCCGSGPQGSGDTTISGAAQRGKWWRFSHVVSNPAGGTGTARMGLEIWAKNVTDNQPEVKILDLRGGSGSPNWSGPYNTIIPPGRVRTVVANGYREGVCLGFEAYSYFMVARWPTDAGQRIGAASEIEGGGGPPPVPAAPAAPRSLQVN